MEYVQYPYQDFRFVNRMALVEKRNTRSLLELPAEIRVMIYKFYLASPVHFRCLPLSRGEKLPCIRPDISLLFTCSLVYKEAINLLYTSNYFVVPGQDIVPTKYPDRRFNEESRYQDRFYLQSYLCSALSISFSRIRRLEIPHHALYLHLFLPPDLTYWNALVRSTPSLEFLAIRVGDHFWNNYNGAELIWYGFNDFLELLKLFIVHRQAGMLRAVAHNRPSASLTIHGSRGADSNTIPHYPALTASLREGSWGRSDWARWSVSSFDKCKEPQLPIVCQPNLREIRLLGGQGPPFPWLQMLGAPCVSTIWKRYGVLEAKKKMDKWGNFVDVRGTTPPDYNLFLRWKG